MGIFHEQPRFPDPYSLNFSLTSLIHASPVHSLHSPYSFCRRDNDVFILHTTGAPPHPDTRRPEAPASACHCCWV